jgi:beta-glucanase (GH16 family)
MKYMLLLLIGALLIAACNKNSANPDSQDDIPKLEGWNLVWHDEFDTEGMPDTKLWKYEWGPDWYNGELQYYANARSENVRVKDGNLVIEVRRESFGGREYTSTRLNSIQGWTFGRMELRAKLPKGEALWPALWMFPVDGNKYGGWPNCGEIDIMENWSWDVTGIYGTVHTQAYNHIIHTQKGGHISVKQPSANFYTYAIEWSTEKLDFFVDDSLYFTFKNEGATDKWPFDHPFRFILNVAVESSAPGKEGTWQKRTMEIDYVRVYKPEE